MLVTVVQKNRITSVFVCMCVERGGKREWVGQIRNWLTWLWRVVNLKYIGYVHKWRLGERCSLGPKAVCWQNFFFFFGLESESESRWVMSDSLWPHRLYSPWNSPGQNKWVAVLFSRDRPNPGIEPRPLILQTVSLPAEPSGKPKNTRVVSLSLLQWIFPNQELNQGLLHCKQILYSPELPGKPLFKEINPFLLRPSSPWVSEWSPLNIMQSLLV